MKLALGVAAGGAYPTFRIVFVSILVLVKLALGAMTGLAQTVDGVALSQFLFW